MAIDIQKSDLARSVQHDPEQNWPVEVKIQLLWHDKDGRPAVRSEIISADQFFGRGRYGAPLDGNFLVQTIERLRRKGPPEVTRKVRNRG